MSRLLTGSTTVSPTRLGRFLCAIVVSVAAVAQGQPAQAENTATTENGAFSFYTNGGWSFGFPAVRAAVSVPRLGTAISPEKKTLPSLGVGIGVKAWKFLVPFADFAVLDTGKAFAQVGSFRSEARADTFTFHGGLRLVGGASRLRPYAQFGGGALRQNLKGTFYNAGNPTPVAGSGSAGSLLYGGGLQFFVGRKWGSVVGVDGFHLNRQLIGGGQNYTRVHFGLFYQTKSSVK